MWLERFHSLLCLAVRLLHGHHSLSFQYGRPLVLDAGEAADLNTVKCGNLTE